MSGYITSGRFRRDSYYDAAIEAHRFARVLLRWGRRHEHRQMMREAIRAWRNFKYWHRKVQQ